jgi:phosphatidylethanolamine-binding protein (PEBP) family uncharacterized protein
MLTRQASIIYAGGLAALTALAVTLAGCGGTTDPTPAKTSARIALASPAITGAEIPARYTCDGANIAPPLRWGAVPPAVGELVLFALGVPSGRASIASAPIEWVIAGVNPQLHEIAAGALPPGAVLLEASDGKRHYSICPPKGHTERYAFAVFAVPPAVRVGNAIGGPQLLKNLVNGPPGGTPEDLSPAQGIFYVSYKRG